MYAYRTNQELSNVFQYWYSTIMVHWSGVMSDSYQLENGVRQGGLFSPTLFDLYINELIVALSRASAAMFMARVLSKFQLYPSIHLTFSFL